MEAKGDEGSSAAHTSDDPTAAELMHSVQEHFGGIKTRLSTVGTSDFQTLDMILCRFSFASLDPA